MHDPDGLVGGEARLGPGRFVAELFFALGHAVGKDDADGFVEVETTLGGTAHVKMDEVAEHRAALRISLAGIRHVVDDGACRVAALADECLGAGLHAREVVGHEEQLHGRLVLILDDDLDLTLFWDAVAASWGGTG